MPATFTPSIGQHRDQAHVIDGSAKASRAIFARGSGKYYDKKYYDPEGFELVTRVLVSPSASTHMVKMADAPRACRSARSEMEGQNGQGASGL